ncbi:MAG: D-aminoacylase, partial [Verrucomicrobia bacterium]|nr:D-aminoacylase [Verrucomicrobiota bacterium]
MKSARLAALALTASLAIAHSASYDLILRNGRVVDGTGNPAFHADVAVKDGRIATIGKISGTAAKEFDLKGLVVAPGFIDVHTHAEDIKGLPEAENFLRMGVTTLVLGNCGGSRTNVAEFFRELDEQRISPNVCTLI